MSTNESEPRGHVQVPRSITARDDVGPAAMLVVGAILTLAKLRKRPSWSSDEVAAHLGWPTRNVQRAIAGLVAAGLVERDETVADGRVHRYQMRAASGAEMPADVAAIVEERVRKVRRVQP